MLSVSQKTLGGLMNNEL